MIAQTVSIRLPVRLFFLDCVIFSSSLYIFYAKAGMNRPKNSKP